MPHLHAGSWGNGTNVLIEKGHIEFDLNLQLIDPAKQTAMIMVHHVPAVTSEHGVPGGVDTATVADTPNNWVE